MVRHRRQRTRGAVGPGGAPVAGGSFEVPLVVRRRLPSWPCSPRSSSAWCWCRATTSWRPSSTCSTASSRSSRSAIIYSYRSYPFLTRQDPPAVRARQPLRHGPRHPRLHPSLTTPNSDRVRRDHGGHRTSQESGGSLSPGVARGRSSWRSSSAGRWSPNWAKWALIWGIAAFQPSASTRNSSVEIVGADVETGDVDLVGARQHADGRLVSGGRPGDPLEHPLQDAAVLAVTGPQEATVLVAAEPVDEEDLRQLGRRRSCRPMCSQWAK